MQSERKRLRIARFRRRTSGSRRPLQLTRIVAIIALLPIAIAGCASRDGGGSNEIQSPVADALRHEGAVEIVDHQYPSSTIQAHLISQVLNKLGGDAKVLAIADLAATFPAVAKQVNLFDPEQWRLLTEAPFKKYVDEDKSVVSFAKSHLVGEEGWYVPTYVISGDETRGIEPTCPGLPAWEALKDCVDVFATPRTGTKGQFLSVSSAYEPSYGNYARIENLDLNYEVEFAGSNAALDAEWKRAYERGEPLLAMMWKPSFTGLTYDITRIELPPYTTECWGTTFACNWGDVDIQSIANPKFEQEYPTYAGILRSYDLNDEQLLSIMTAVQIDGLTPEDAVAEWIEQNPTTWQQWAA